MCGEEPRGRCRWWQRATKGSFSFYSPCAPRRRRRRRRASSSSRRSRAFSLPRDTPFARIAVATIAADSTADSARSCCDPAYRSSRRDRRERRGEEGERERRKERAHASRPPDTSRPLFTRVQRGASRLSRKNGSLANGAHKITISRPVIAVAVVVVLVPVLVIVSSAVVQLLLLPGASYTGGETVQHRGSHLDAPKAAVYAQKLRDLERTKARRNEVDVTQ